VTHSLYASPHLEPPIAVFSCAEKDRCRLEFLVRSPRSCARGHVVLAAPDTWVSDVRDRGYHRVLAVPMVIAKYIRRARSFQSDYGTVRMKVVDSQRAVETVRLLRQL